ncbi:MAG: helix-turn-helix domain-containing protein [Candidatus Gracilibacteria bacterium]|jgi:excisionase family DNA binding protein
MEENILTPDQVAQKLQMHPFTVLKFIKQGKLKASKLGRVYRIRESDVSRFLDEQAETSVAKSRKSLTPKETSQVSLDLVVETKEDALKSPNIEQHENVVIKAAPALNPKELMLPEFPSGKSKKSDSPKNPDGNVVPKKRLDPADKMFELDHYVLE